MKKLFLQIILCIFGINYLSLNFTVIPLGLIAFLFLLGNDKLQYAFTNMSLDTYLHLLQLLLMVFCILIINMIPFIFGLKLLKKNNPSTKEIISITAIMLYLISYWKFHY